MPDDIEQGKDRAAFERIVAMLRDIPSDEVAVPNVDVGAAVVALMPVARRAASESMRPRFARLPPEEFAIRHVDEIESMVRATRYAQSLHASALATRPGDARVPADVAAEAAEVKSRMVRVVMYWFDDDAVLGAEIEAIRSGHGHLDTAQDLIRLARIYRERADTVRADGKHYREADVARAEALAERIFDALGVGGPARSESADTLGRAWTLLRRTYDEVAAAGRWLWRHEGGDARFPTIHAASRARSTTTRPKADGNVTPGEEPVTPVN